MIYSKQIPATVPAGVLRAPNKLEIVDIPMWPIESYNDPGLVLIETGACGVCGSDYRYFAGENPWAQHTLGRHMDNPPNIVLGHEFAGTVVGIQSKAHEHMLGHRVAPICSKVCGYCVDCREGRSRLCQNTVHLGHGQGWGDQPFFPGAYCQYTVAWADSCFPIDDSLTFKQASMLDILAVCVHVTNVGNVQPGRPVLCIGGGPAGNGCAQAAMNRGASFVVIVDRDEAALSVASKQGLTHTVNSQGMSDADLVAKLKVLAPNGFGSVFDSVGAGSTIELGLEALGNAGTLVNMAVHDSEMQFNYMRLGSEKKITTSCNFEVGDYPTSLSWLENGRFKVNEWQTEIALRDIPKLFEDAKTDKPVFKAVIIDFS